MNYTEFALLLLYGTAIVFVVLLIVRVLTPTRAPEVVVVDARPSTAGWWPWGTTVYNNWPFWGGWWNGGSDGGYSRSYEGRHWTGPGHIETGDRPWGGSSRYANHGAPAPSSPSSVPSSAPSSSHSSGHSSHH